MMKPSEHLNDLEVLRWYITTTASCIVDNANRLVCDTDSTKVLRSIRINASALDLPIPELVSEARIMYDSFYCEGL